MSIKLMSQVWDVQSLTQPRKMLLLAVADFANDEGVSWPAVETLMRKCSFKSDSGVRRALTELAEAGWLSKSTRSVKAANGRRQQGSNAYQMNLAKLLSESLSEPASRTVSKFVAEPAPRMVSNHVLAPSLLTGSNRATELASYAEQIAIAEPAPRTVSKSISEPVPHEGSQYEPTCHEALPHESSCQSKKPSFEPVPHTPDPSLRSQNDPSVSKSFCQLPSETDPEVTIADRAISVLKHLNHMTGSRYQNAKTSLENIRARLNEGFTLDELVLTVDYLTAKWAKDLEMAEYLRPSTLFKPTKFPAYLEGARRWHDAGRPARHEGKWLLANFHRVTPATGETPPGFMSPEQYLKTNQLGGGQ